mmetsp:Transcript_92/g.191  ORF Transcript_92/g.191 Transcript_92/m.191 type:complete len:113 (-) Transcript_92:380-718(-)
MYSIAFVTVVRRTSTQTTTSTDPLNETRSTKELPTSNTANVDQSSTTLASRSEVLPTFVFPMILFGRNFQIEYPPTSIQPHHPPRGVKDPAVSVIRFIFREDWVGSDLRCCW